MRVNIEDDLRTSGRLGKLARVMGWTEREALGALVLFYRATQNAEVCEAPEDELVSLCVIDHDSDDDARRFVRGLLSSRLASANQDTIVIHGNAQQVERIKALRKNASAGGRARMNRPTNLKPVAKQMASNSLANQCPPCSLLPSPAPFSNTNTEIQNGIVVAPTPIANAAEAEIETRSEIMTATPSALAVAEKKPRKVRSPEQKERSLAVNRRYRERYHGSEGHWPSGMDQQANGIIARFSDKHAENAIAILDWFFDCPDTGFKRSGWALQLLFDQAPKLWRELNDKRKAVENLAAPAQQRIIARNASNDIELERANQILAMELNR